MSRVVVVTPTYNRVEFLERAIKSVLAQTHSDFVYFIACNGSPQDTKDLVLKYVAQDHRIKMLTYKKPDIFRTLEQVFSLLDCDYVYVMGDDDIIYPTFLEEMLKPFDDDPKKYSFAVCDFEITQNGKITYKVANSGSFIRTLMSKYWLDEIKKDAGYYFDVHLRMYADWDMFIRLENKLEHYYLSKSLSLYTQHSGNYSSKPMMGTAFELITFNKRRGNPMSAMEILSTLVRQAKWIFDYRRKKGKYRNETSSEVGK